MSHIVVAGDDVNCLVYKYLQENGYKHTAFAFECEAKLDSESILKRKIAPRHLVSLLEKSLLLSYLETHIENVRTVL